MRRPRNSPGSLSSVNSMAASAAPQYGIALVPKRGKRLELDPLARKDLADVYARLLTIATTFNVPERWTTLHDRHAGFLEGLNNYSRSFAKRRQLRIISVPDEATKARQRVILQRLERIPVHRAAFGFVRGRGPRDCAAAHLAFHGTAPHGLLLLNADVQDFFHSISGEVVEKSLTAHGMPTEEARSIVERCTLKADSAILVKLLAELRNRFVPGSFVDNSLLNSQWELVANWLQQTDDGYQGVLNPYRMTLLRHLLGVGTTITSNDRFLPQGAPTSPVLANLACKLIDIRLEAMARAFGAFYTRYADDFVFSWKIPETGKIKGKVVDGLRRCSAEVIAEYGLTFNPAKIRTLSPKYAQDVVGYLINSGQPTIARSYRQNIRRQIRRLDDPVVRRTNDLDVEIPRLQGCVGHIASAHPDEARALRARLERHLDTTPHRRVSVTAGTYFPEPTYDHHDHDEEENPRGRHFARPLSENAVLTD